MKRITDKTFRYTPSFATDIRKTFAKVRRQAAKTVPEKPVPQRAAQ